MPEKTFKIKNKVKEFREANAWSVSELARRAALVPQTISKMEKVVLQFMN